MQIYLATKVVLFRLHRRQSALKQLFFFTQSLEEQNYKLQEYKQDCLLFFWRRHKLWSYRIFNSIVQNLVDIF